MVTGRRSQLARDYGLAFVCGSLLVLTAALPWVFDDPASRDCGGFTARRRSGWRWPRPCRPRPWRGASWCGSCSGRVWRRTFRRLQKRDLFAVLAAVVVVMFVAVRCSVDGGAGRQRQRRCVVAAATVRRSEHGVAPPGALDRAFDGAAVAVLATSAVAALGLDRGSRRRRSWPCCSCRIRRCAQRASGRPPARVARRVRRSRRRSRSATFRSLPADGRPCRSMALGRRVAAEERSPDLVERTGRRSRPSFIPTELLTAERRLDSDELRSVRLHSARSVEIIDAFGLSRAHATSCCATTSAATAPGYLGRTRAGDSARIPPPRGGRCLRGAARISTATARRSRRLRPRHDSRVEREPVRCSGSDGASSRLRPPARSPTRRAGVRPPGSPNALGRRCRGCG